jgi:predicted XRE-type DNA-binding protein
MRKDQRQRLESAGWKFGDASDFLGLSAEETRFIETKLALADGLRKRREQAGLTQTELARRLKSSQSRVAKMETADPSVSMDLLLRSLFHLGANRQDVARMFAPNLRRAA